MPNTLRFYSAYQIKSEKYESVCLVIMMTVDIDGAGNQAKLMHLVTVVLILQKAPILVVTCCYIKRQLFSSHLYEAFGFTHVADLSSSCGF